MKMIRCGCQSLACYDAAGLRGTQAEWELGTVSPLELMKFSLMIRKKMAQLSQTNVVWLIEYDVLAIMYYEINTLKCVLHFFLDIELFVTGH